MLFRHTSHLKMVANDRWDLYLSIGINLNLTFCQTYVSVPTRVLPGITQVLQSGPRGLVRVFRGRVQNVLLEPKIPNIFRYSVLCTNNPPEDGCIANASTTPANEAPFSQYPVLVLLLAQIVLNFALFSCWLL